MSNHLAIATVTATLGQLVHSAAHTSGVSGVGLRFGRPTTPATSGERKVHIYLYQVAPNAALRNTDAPTRDPHGTLLRVPRAALDLSYLISFFGDADELEPERMLGAAVRALHAQPLLTRAAIANAVASYAALSGSNLAAAIERVRMTPLALTLDEMSRLWSVMTQTPHALSLAYQATVVLVEPDATVASPSPVLSIGPDNRGVDVQVGAAPAITGIWIGTPSGFERGAARPPSFPSASLGLRLALRVAGGDGDSLALRFEHARRGAVQVAIPSAQRAGDEIFVDLTAALAGATGWSAGVYHIALVVTRGAEERVSSAMPIALAPRVVSIVPAPAARDAAGAVTVTFRTDPPVRTGQVARLLVGALDVALPPATADRTDTPFAISAAPAVAAAIARLRVQEPAGPGQPATSVESMPFRYDPGTGRFTFDDTQRVTIT
jgi:hypothetical protein